MARMSAARAQYVSMPLGMDDVSDVSDVSNVSDVSDVNYVRYVSAQRLVLLVLTPNDTRTSDWDFEDIMDLLEDSNTNRSGCC